MGELFFHILSFLDVESLCAAHRVSRAWNRLASDYEVPLWMRAGWGWVG